MNNAQLSELNLRQANEEPLRKRIAELEAFARYVIENSGERTLRDKADEILKR